MAARLIAFLLACCWAGLGLAGEVIKLDMGEFLVSPATTPPDRADWRPQALPDLWRNAHRIGIENAWYRFQFQALPADTNVQAVYLPKLVMNAEVWVNEVKIGSGGRMEEPLSRNWNRPLLFIVPYGLIKPGANVVHIRLRGNAYTQPALFPFYIGAENQLRAKHERALFLNITLNQSATILIVAIGLLMVSLWWRRRSEPAYGYFGASALIWAAQSSNLYVRDAPLDTAYWERLFNASYQVVAALLLASVLQFIAAWKPAYRHWFGVLLIGAPLTLAITPAAHFLQTTSFWHLVTLGAALFTLAHTLKSALSGNREARLLVAALVLIVLFALHDWLLHSAHLWNQYVGELLGGDLTLLQYSAPLLFLAIGWIMTSRYINTLKEFERLNSELDQRVKDREAALAASYVRMKELEMTQAVVAERERIHSDLHDDVGAKLLSLVYRAESGENAELARSALQDLRDVVSQTSAGSTLEELAADWRAECDKRLSEARIKLTWDEADSLSGVQLTQPQVLNLSRILRESISNIIRHAQARQASVILKVTAGTLVLSIQDDGVGNVTTATPGRGLRSMAARAQKLGGSLIHYTPAGGGHGVRMEMRIDDNRH